MLALEFVRLQRWTKEEARKQKEPLNRISAETMKETWAGL
jgi:hypothetical protein